MLFLDMVCLTVGLACRRRVSSDQSDLFDDPLPNSSLEPKMLTKFTKEAGTRPVRRGVSKGAEDGHSPP
jgi:hypothetical protein